MNKVKLSSLLHIRRGQSLPGSHYSESGQLKRLTLGNFDYPGGGFKENTAKRNIYFIGDVGPEFILSEGDIITPLTEQVAGLLGETATIPCSNVYIQSGDIGLVVPNEMEADKRFLAYLVSSPMVKKQLAAGAQQTKIRHTSPEAIENCIVWVPETIVEQSKISALLDLINSEIGLNSSICSDLEAAAKLLYDYWFVQFDFPDENGKPYKSSGGKMVWNEELKREIPEGWTHVGIGNIGRIESGATPSTKDEANFDGDIAWITPNDLSRSNGSLLIGAGSRNITEKGYRSCSAVKVPKGTVIMSSRAPIGYTAVATTTLCTNQGCKSIVPNERYGTWFSLFTIRRFMPLIESQGSGTTFREVSKEGLSDVKVINPAPRIIAKFNSLIADVMKLYEKTQSAGVTCMEVRDFLLPLLMNGQVTIGDDGK